MTMENIAILRKNLADLMLRRFKVNLTTGPLEKSSPY